MRLGFYTPACLMLQSRLEGTMFRTLLRLIVVMVVLVAGAMFFLGYRLNDLGDRGGVQKPPNGSTAR